MRTDDLDIPDLLLSWRLLAANNRDVARSAAPYPDLTSCLEAVAKLQSQIDDAVAVAARSGRADWSWRLRMDGRDAAVSSRTYQRRLQCEAACALFVALVRDATLDVFGHGEALQAVASPDECGAEAPVAGSNAEHGDPESGAPGASAPTNWVSSHNGQVAEGESVAPGPAPTQPAPVDPAPVDPVPGQPAGLAAPALPAATASPTGCPQSVSPSTGSSGTASPTWSAGEIVPPQP